MKTQFCYEAASASRAIYRNKGETRRAGNGMANAISAAMKAKTETRNRRFKTGDRFSSHQTISSPAVFAFNKTAFAAKLINFASKRTNFAVKVTAFAANLGRFAMKQVCFAAVWVSTLEKTICFEYIGFVLSQKHIQKRRRHVKSRLKRTGLFRKPIALALGEVAFRQSGFSLPQGNQLWRKGNSLCRKVVHKFRNEY